MSNTFIFDAFQATTAYRGYKGDIAKFLDKLNDGDDLESFEQMFEDAIIIAAETEVFAPMAIVGHLQQVMNKVCWNARKLFNANNKPSVVWGSDPAEQSVDDTGVSITNDNLSQVVDDDFNALFAIQSNLLACLDDDGYMEPLYYFTEDEVQPNGDWITVTKCTSFDEAFTHMDAVAEKLRTQQAATIAERIAARRAARQAA